MHNKYTYTRISVYACVCIDQYMPMFRRQWLLFWWFWMPSHIYESVFWYFSNCIFVTAVRVRYDSVGHKIFIRFFFWGGVKFFKCVKWKIVVTSFFFFKSCCNHYELGKSCLISLVWLWNHFFLNIYLSSYQSWCYSKIPADWYADCYSYYSINEYHGILLNSFVFSFFFS